MLFEMRYDYDYDGWLHYVMNGFMAGIWESAVVRLM